MKPLPVSVALAVLVTAGRPAQDLPPEILLLARVKQHGRATFEHIPDYACLETIHRFEKPRDVASFRPIDTLHLEVASAGGKELLARQGAARFGDGDLHAFISQGTISSGAFASTPLNLFVRDVARITPLPQEGMIAGTTLRFHFEESAMTAGFFVQSGESKGQVGLRGTFWVDSQTLDLVRIEEQAVESAAHSSHARPHHLHRLCAHTHRFLRSAPAAIRGDRSHRLLRRRKEKHDRVHRLPRVHERVGDPLRPGCFGAPAGSPETIAALVGQDGILRRVGNPPVRQSECPPAPPPGRFR